MDQEQQPSKQTPGDQLLRRLGADPNEWTIGDRRLALLAIVIGLVIVIITVCGYVYGLMWTGLAKQTFWDWLSLLIVPLVLALGGYLFTRSESRRAQSVAEQQSALDRELADQRTNEDRKTADERRQDDLLQAYLDQKGQLLIDKELRQAKDDAEVRTLARARTVTVLPRLDGDRKRSILQFLYESALIDRDHTVVDLTGADLSGATLSGARLGETNLGETNLSGADLSSADLRGADLHDCDLTEANLSGLSEAELGETGLSGKRLFLVPSNSVTISGLRELGLTDAQAKAVLVDGAKLRGANLRRAVLSEAAVTKRQLRVCEDLTGATMPNGQSTKTG